MGLIVGFLTRVSAFGIGCVMVVAILMAHLHNGFFMNWFGDKSGEGFEYHLLAIGLALGIMIRGGGKWSIDRFIQTKIEMQYGNRFGQTRRSAPTIGFDRGLV